MLEADGYGLLPLPEVDPVLLDAFGCGKAHLDAFLRTDARELHSARLGWTTVVVHRDVDGLVGYFTLANDVIQLMLSERFELQVPESIRSVPAVRIGRLAISAALQGSGAGRAVMELIRGEILDAKYLSAARLLTLDADEDVVGFYSQLGFIESLWAADQAKKSPRKSGVPTVKMLRDVLA